MTRIKSHLLLAVALACLCVGPAAGAPGPLCAVPPAGKANRAAVRQMQALIAQGRLEATGDFAALRTCDAVSICVPTPLSKTRDPDISYIVTAVQEVALPFDGTDSGDEFGFGLDLILDGLAGLLPAFEVRP